MALAEFMKSLDGLVAAAEQAFDSAEENDALEAARVEFLGAKQGKLKAVQKQMGSIEKTDRPAAGKRFNEVKQQIEGAFQAATQRLESGAAEQDASERGASEQGGAGKSGRRGREVFDPTLPGETLRIGRLHPITRTIEELKDIMGRLGFSVVLGPEIEDEWHNFKALNIPDDHPARDPLENFYLAAEAAGSAAATSAAATSDSTSSAAPSDTDAPLLLRSQTSTVQIRVMEKTPPPVRIISLGRVYRPDTADRTHYPMFHQMEGLLIDKHVTMADLKSVLRLFATSYLGDDVHIRFRPSFFPFTEPSVEADFSWHDGWVEFGGAGMVDPHVLEAVGYDPEEVTGFAFGLGVERLCMRRHGITDIRELYKNDIRFLHQF